MTGEHWDRILCRLGKRERHVEGEVVGSARRTRTIEVAVNLPRSRHEYECLPVYRVVEKAHALVAGAKAIRPHDSTAPACPETPFVGKDGVMPGSTSRRYPPELRERAVRMVAEVRASHATEWAAMRAVSELLGIGTTETVRKWVRQAEIDDGSRPGVSTEESGELKRLKRENAELKRANGILKAASAFFAAELDRPQR